MAIKPNCLAGYRYSAKNIDIKLEAGHSIDCITHWRRLLDRLFVFFDRVTLTIDFLTNIISERDIVMNYLCAKFGDFSFSRFGFIERTDRRTESQTPLNALLTRLWSAWVTRHCHVMCLFVFQHSLYMYKICRHTFTLRDYIWLKRLLLRPKRSQFLSFMSFGNPISLLYTPYNSSTASVKFLSVFFESL